MNSLNKRKKKLPTFASLPKTGKNLQENLTFPGIPLYLVPFERESFILSSLSLSLVSLYIHACVYVWMGGLWYKFFNFMKGIVGVFFDFDFTLKLFYLYSLSNVLYFLLQFWVIIWLSFLVLGVHWTVASIILTACVSLWFFCFVMHLVLFSWGTVGDEVGRICYIVGGIAITVVYLLFYNVKIMVVLRRFLEKKTIVCLLVSSFCCLLKVGCVNHVIEGFWT